MVSSPFSKSLKNVTADLKNYWEPVLRTMQEASPYFTGKVSYMSDGKKVVRLFPSELSKGNSCYMELLNFDLDYIEPKRVLYRLPFKEDWKTLYKEFNTEKGPTYMVPVSAMEIINTTPMESVFPIIIPESVSFTTTPAKPSFTSGLFGGTVVEEPVEDLFDEDKFSEEAEDNEDAHYTSGTLRDLYCILHNVPMSNKKWINSLIKKGTQWQLQQLQQLQQK